MIAAITNRPTQRAPDWWESARFQAVCVALSWFRQSGVISSRPPAGNASRWAAEQQIVTWKGIGIQSVFDIQRAKINTAGAYVCINGLYLFTMGIKPHNGHIPVVRIGGHQEGNESGWQCAMREVFEETNLRIKPRFSQSTYLYDWDHLETEPSSIQWQHEISQEPAPLLVITYQHDGITTLSLMYSAIGEGSPNPSSEVKGLLFLTEKEIHRLCQEPITLKNFLNNGGKAILKDEFDTSFLLEPFAQLRLLSRILSIQPEKNAA